MECPLNQLCTRIYINSVIVEPYHCYVNVFSTFVLQPSLTIVVRTQVTDRCPSHLPPFTVLAVSPHANSSCITNVSLLYPSAPIAKYQFLSTLNLCITMHKKKVMFMHRNVACFLCCFPESVRASFMIQR